MTNEAQDANRFTPEIRPAQTADLTGATRLLESAGLPIAGVEAGWGHNYAVAQGPAGELVGVAGFEAYPPYALLRSVAVSPDWRGQGVASRLVTDRLAAAAGRGLGSVYLLTTTARDYFGRHGFHEIARADVPAEVQACDEFLSACPVTATVMVRPADVDPGAQIRTAVRRKYGGVARSVARAVPEQTGGACCTPQPAAANCCGGSTGDPITRDLYDALQTDELPAAAVLASLGCGNPTALAELKQGEVVLDLGSGGGIDVLLSARRVGPTGKAYGLDLTPDMVNLARRNAREAGVTNVEFMRGEIEHIPLPTDSVDVVISNCVINLSADKAQVLREAYRVLRPGGRFAVSDIVTPGDLPAEVRADLNLWTSCIAGALSETEFRTLLAAAGFIDVEIQPTRLFKLADLAAEGSCCCDGQPAEYAGASQYEGEFMSAFVRGTKPLDAASHR